MLSVSTLQNSAIEIALNNDFYHVLWQCTTMQGVEVPYSTFPHKGYAGLEAQGARASCKEEERNNRLSTCELA